MVSMKTVMVILMTILFSSLFISQSSHAEIYKWVDDKGTVNFTEDPETIPEKYREKAGSRMTEEDLMTPEEKIRAKKRHEEEVRERQKRENKGYNAKEFEKKVKEMEDQAKKKRQEGKCEIISYSQYDVNSGDGYISGDVSRSGSLSGYIYQQKNTCVDLVIQNNDRESKTITDKNFIATTSKRISTTEGRDIFGRSIRKEKDKFNPKAVSIQLNPGETYQGSICFDRQLPIAKLELQGL